MKAGTAILFISIFLFHQSSAQYRMDSGEKDNLNAEISAADYLSPLEKEIIAEINILRANPANYAENQIAPLARHYNKKMLYYPGDKPLLTKEGVAALHECVRELKQQRPLPLIIPDKGLSMAARDHVKDQSKTGKTGHNGSDNSTMRNRIERYGSWNIRIGENIAYGGKNARQIIIYLLIDDGISHRGHRKNFLNPEFRKAGIAAGNHPGYGLMSVMDFAGEFTYKENTP